MAQGEVVGIIGRNGAGKSTLLKILSRITYPTRGTLSVHGRVASLLEVGTGFHEELTGRENIFLNGSIMGMARADVKARLDQIIEFSGVERFIDTPIKRYSSGMRLRLGFAVAAHLEPDLLIIDEVLAVGDAGFQKKCLDAMGELRSGGRTVLFVSHNMAAVENLCQRGIWIDQGTVRMDGPVRDVIETYMSSFTTAASGSDLLAAEGRTGSGEVRFTKMEMLTVDRRPKDVVRYGDSLCLRLHYRAEAPIRYPVFDLYFWTELGTLITETSTWHHGIEIPVLPAGDGYVRTGDQRYKSPALQIPAHAAYLWNRHEQQNLRSPGALLRPHRGAVGRVWRRPGRQRQIWNRRISTTVDAERGVVDNNSNVMELSSAGR